ncbi:MAG: M56 family metallopeptidase [Pirellulaceae bacterium]|nr:M56 family metallopeptidase [Pirellulaceae bacterium]
MNPLLALSSPFFESIVERLGWVLVHSLWQFAIVALLAWVIVRAMRRSSSALRYGVLVTAMAVMVSAPIASSIWISSDSPLEHSADPVASASADETVAANGLETAGAWLANKSPIADDTPIEGPIRELAPTSIPSKLLPATPPLSASETPPSLFWSARAKAMLQPWLAWIVAVWCLGVVLCSARPLLGWHTLRRLKRVGVSPVSDEVLAALRGASERLGLRRSVQLLQSTLAQVPMLVGYFRPVILLPISLMTSIPATQLDAILTHELAHIQRHDFIVNLLQTLVETFFFYHPAVWWLSRQIRVEREHCCDDLVVKLLGNRIEYGRALVAIEQLRGRGSVLAIGAADGSLLSRVRRIVGFHSTGNVTSAVERWPAALLVLALIATTVLLTLNWNLSKNLADNSNEDQPSETFTLIQLDPPPVVGDFSNADDPDVLLDQLAKSQLPGLVPMTGGKFFQQPGAPPQANDVSLWETQYAGNDQLDPRIRRLIELGDRAVPSVHQRLNGLTASELLATHLTLVLGSVGTTESVPVLIKLMKTAPIAASDGTQSIEEFQKNYQASLTQIAVTSALWKLTGRKHLFTPDQWEKWWQSVKPDFVVPLERTRPEFVTRVTPERVEALVDELATNELAARERLISLGPAAIPHLLNVLSVAESLRAPASPSDAAAIRLAWVVDELGATDKLSAKLGRDYFTHRFSDDDTYAGMYPIDEDALGRALSYCSFADFCSIYVEADSRGNVPEHMTHIKWPYDIYSAYCRRFSKLVARDTGGRSDDPHWRNVVPAENPSDEIANAVPILLAALKDKRAETRISASKLADAIGFCTTAKPETLIVALRDAWLAEADEKVRPEIGFAMCRFQTPFVMQEISQGLLSDRPEIVSDCAGLMDWIPIELNDETRFAFDRLVELTRHEDDRIRRGATRSLASKAPQLLGPEFERLCTDKVNDIREACTLALRSDPDPQHADILFKLADDAEQTIRESAFSSISNLNHPPSMKRLLPYLRETKVHGYAVSALASMGGKDAIPLMMGELESGNDVGGMVYQHLRRLTGEDFEEKPEPWLAWWMKNNSAPVSFPNRLTSQASSGTGPGNEKTDPAKQSVEIRLVGGPNSEPLPKVKVEFTSGGSDRKSFGTFTTDDAGLLKASLPVGFYYLHLTSDQELPYLPVEYLWDKESRGPRPDLSLNVTKSGVEKWLAGKKRDEGYEPPAEPNNLPRITYRLLPACELTLRAADADTGEGLPGVEFYEENAVGEDWAHAICGQNIRSIFSWDREPVAAAANHTDQDGNFRRLVSANAGFTYGVWKPPAGYEAVTPGEVEIDIRYGQLRAEHIFKFRRIGREVRVELEKEKSMLDEPM